jgi:2-dehydro-3-deoxyphosphogluconate aldolase/(4S)-4-hydroxy-2-oxoglutarate aldolase
MVKGDLIKAGEFDKIRELTKEAAALAKEIRG